MELLQRARDLIRGYSPSADLKSYLAEGYHYWNGANSEHSDAESPQNIAASLSYQIGFAGAPIANERDVPLGSSKYRGLPHLPRGMDWPAGMLFSAQLNLEELARVDRSERLPKAGMLYLFFNNQSDCAAVHWQGDPDELEIREYPDVSVVPDAKYYLDELRRGQLMTPEPYWLFYLNKGDAYDYGDLIKLLPPQLLSLVTDLLGARPRTTDRTRRLYGRPHNWQGEDAGLGEPDGFDEQANPIWDDDDDDAAPDLLLWQDELGDATVHLWCKPENVAKGDFSSVWMSGSTT